MHVVNSSRGFGILATSLFAIAMIAGVARVAAENRMTIRFPAAETRPWLSVQAPGDGVTIVQGTADFRGWSELLRGHGSIHFVPDLAPNAAAHRFYRTLIQPRTATDDWKNVLSEADPFRSPEPPPDKHESRWVKFVMLLNAPHRVVFQDSSKYAFHYDFAATRLPEFRGFTRSQFDAVTLRTNQQMAVLGAVLLPPTTNLMEAGIQFVGLDPYPRAAIAQWFQTVRAMVDLPPAAQMFYLPTFEQREVAQTNVNWFAERGIPVSSADRWVIADQIYAPGWALGRLVFVPGHEIAAAYRQGRLTPQDILLTDAVPAEVPPLAGIVTLSPATPNSHVALLARSFGIPFVYVAQPDFPERVMSWAGREVVLRAVDAYAERHVLVAPVEEEMPAGLRDEIAALKIPPRLSLPAKTSMGQVSTGVDGLVPADIRFVGGKAANFGILRRSIPTNSPSPVIAFTFDLWDAYLDQVLPDQKTLRAAIAEQLQGFAWPPDMPALQAALAEVRDWITDVADVSTAQQTAILNALQSAGFDPNRKIRFRSSTNVEDSEQFSGAGLYDSFSGCLADDLDADGKGPSQCDPEEPKERGVFRALRKVYASFYNDNAFLERLRHGVDETQVGMSVLVHHSTPDPEEMANGVATLQIRHYGGGSWEIRTRLVTQLGAVSVTNPDTASRPEEVSVVDFASGPRAYPSVVTRSSLVPLGDTVLKWEDEYQALYGLLKSAAQRWQRETGTNAFVILDFEYKKVQPGRLSVKQIRTLPLPLPPTRMAPYLISTTNRYAVFQGELGDVVSNHRLKSFWGVTTRNLRWAESNLTETVLSTLDGQWLEHTNLMRFSGPIASWPEYRFSREPDHTSDRWSQGAGAQRREFDWRVHDIDTTAQGLGPLAVLEDHRMQLFVTYATPQPILHDEDFSITNTVTEWVWIAPVLVMNVDRVKQTRSLHHDRIEIMTSYYWPREPRETGAGYTAPLLAWAGTTIHGLTSRPIVLQGEFSQTYRPGHHNGSEDFVFDPWLEPGVDPELLAELSQANIRAVIVRRGRPSVPVTGGSEPAGASGSVSNGFVPGDEDIFVFWGLDGTFRERL